MGVDMSAQNERLASSLHLHTSQLPLFAGILGGSSTLYVLPLWLCCADQEFHKPFDSPAVLVVGHQTSGKSALIEALMGFQFNQVGGGTKTRRPIALRMQYNPECDQPRCHLTLENGREEPR